LKLSVVIQVIYGPISANFHIIKAVKSSIYNVMYPKYQGCHYCYEYIYLKVVIKLRQVFVRT